MPKENGNEIKTITPFELASFLDGLLSESSDPMDSSLNGLQVNSDKAISKVAVAVDACLQAFQVAREMDCQMVIAHHGLYWSKGEHRVIGIMGERVSFLIRNNISLWACHIPIDRHSKYGNNAVLAKILDVNQTEGFSNYHEQPIGLWGHLKQEMSVNKIAISLSKKLPHCSPLIWDFGKESVNSVGIVSGGGSFAIEDASSLGLDLLVTGEVGYSDYHTAKENKLNVIAAGHWATETVGIRAVGNEITKQLGIETEFISVPTGL
jgi:dinuclear metal center YbgI/SA1388 family protein